MKDEVITLGDVVTEIRNGIDLEQFDRPTRTATWPISRIETISEARIDLDRVKYVSPTPQQVQRYQLCAGDILFSHINSPEHIGKTALFKGERPLIHGINLLLIRTDSSKCCPAYLDALLKSSSVRFHFRMRCKKAVNQASLNQDDILSLQIRLPCLSHQQRVAKQLEQADRQRHTRSYALELTDTFLPALFLELFGDPQSNPRGWDGGIIDDVVVFSQYGTSQKSNSASRGYPILGMGNITNRGSIDLSTYSHVDLSKEEFESLALQRGDIIFNRTNSTELVGKTSYWNLDMNAVLASYLVRLRLKPEVLPEFLAALLNTGYFKNLFRDRCKKAVGQSNISPTLLKEFPVYIPPIPLQRKFADLVHRVERLRAVQREALRHAEHLYGTLLHIAFNG